MTFMDMIAQLDGKHMAYRNSLKHIEYYSINNRVKRINQKQGMVIINHRWTIDEKKATDWIIEKIEE